MGQLEVRELARHEEDDVRRTLAGVGDAFCVVRPGCHHAAPDRGEGFCLFNHTGIAVRHAQHRHGVERVLIVDDHPTNRRILQLQTTLWSMRPDQTHDGAQTVPMMRPALARIFTRGAVV